MKVGRFKIGKVYVGENKTIKWAVYGKTVDKRWVVCFDETRHPKDLVFDLEYDACGYLDGFIEWQTGELMQHQLAASAAERVFGEQERVVRADKKAKNKAKRKMAKQARRRNR